MKVKNIIVKAPNEEHKLILEKVGATEVIIPEKEMADKIAKSIVSPNVLDYIPLADDYMICEIAPPSGFIGKTLAEIQLRSKYHIDVIAVRDMLTEKINMVPAANFVVKDSEVLIVVGKEDGYRQNKIRVYLVFRSIGLSCPSGRVQNPRSGRLFAYDFVCFPDL